MNRTLCKARLMIVLAVLILVPQMAAAQEETPEPGVGAASELPEAAVLGTGWVRYDVVSPDLLARYRFEMTPDVFSEGAAGLYAGPNGARAVIVRLIVTDSRVAIRASWEDSTDLLGGMTTNVTEDYERMQALESMTPPAPCVEAKRAEGVEGTYLAPVGATMCADESDGIWIVMVSGSLDGAMGVPASDALTEAVVGSS